MKKSVTITIIAIISISVLVFLNAWIFNWVISNHIDQHSISNMLSNKMRFANSPSDFKLITTEISEELSCKIQFSICIGFIFTLPIVYYQFWNFPTFAPHGKERAKALRITSACTLLIALGLIFAITVLSPLAILNLMAPQNHLIQSSVTLQRFINITHFFIVFSAIFLHIFYLIVKLVSEKKLTHQSMKKKRKIIFIVILLISFLISPSSHVLKILTIILYYSLYEISILIATIAKKKIHLKSIDSQNDT